MSRKFLLSIIAVLLITNIATLLFWSTSKSKLVEDDETDVQIDTKKPVATINNTEITYKAWMGKLRENYGKKQLKTMIDRTIVEKLAEEKNITVDEKIIEREIALLTSAQGVMTQEETEKMEKKWRNEIKYRYQLEALLAEDISVPENEIRAYYDTYGQQYDFTESLQFSHILVNDMETAEKVKEELDNGASFSLLAKEYSIDEDTKNAGGYFGGYYTTNSQFLPNGYDEKAAEMEEYSYSDPFLTDQGYAILYLHRSMPEITFSYEELKPYIRNELALESAELTLQADPLWDTFEIDWLYNE
ncbi:peptidyl-prolyl cis-trans isomerase [Ornithinibacillus salinisoli]|uniref:peptidylprolyl isomerase n=1 Tax=Ornithinibacillus salinisoli TaxID=1848459 RepID=A0ABW4W460_9BACI